MRRIVLLSALIVCYNYSNISLMIHARASREFILPQLINKVAHVTAYGSHQAIMPVTFPRRAHLSHMLFAQTINRWENA